MNKLSIVLLFAVLAGCASNKEKIASTLKNNPDLLFQVIEENPERFIEVVNRAAQSAQQKQYEQQLRQREAKLQEQIKNPLGPELSDDRRLYGEKSGDIVIVEYADFECPACRIAYDNLDQFKSKYGDRVQFYYKHLPLSFHKMAEPSARYFEAIRLQSSHKARKFYEYLFENQQRLKESGFLDVAAKMVGANQKQLRSDLESEKVNRILKSDLTEVEKFKFTGTPVIVLNGIALHGAQSLADLEKAVRLTTQK